MKASELPSQYKPQDVEPRIDQFWKEGKYFHADPAASAPPYCIVIPPPNVTAALHMGHALNNTLQDILVRYHRMLGQNAVWIPGTDHAGIATQTVVEKRVLKEEGKKRTDFQREEFVAKIQAWKDEYEARILNQLKLMGCSCDWDRTRFTMDPVCAKAVREAFFRLFKDGLIYRGKRLVNWDPATQTALADDEVEMQEIDGHFWYLKYPLVEPVEFNGQTMDGVIVATTRPETMLGDTAVAINPKDPRAKALKGKSVQLPIVDRVIPIVEDDYVVLPDETSDDPKAKFATGFLKVTPAHDPNDYEIGQRHNLPIVNVLAPDGTISDQHGWTDVGGAEELGLLGLDRYEAREAIVEWFRENNLLTDVKPYRHSVGHSYRSHVPIEPYLSNQWYVKVTDNRLAKAALRTMAPDQRDDTPFLLKRRDREGACSSLGDREGACSMDTPTDSLDRQAYMITFTCYGTWLHGDLRGSTDPKNNAYGEPFMSEDEQLEQADFHRLQHAPFALNAQQRETVSRTITEVCRHRGWRIHAGQVRSNHVHVVVEADQSPERVMNDFKSYATRRLTENGLISPGTRVWTRHGSTRYLFDQKSMENACQYVVDGQGEDMEGATIVPTSEPVDSGPNHSPEDKSTLPHGRVSLRKEWEGKLRFFPERYAKTFQAWHENIRDWCISRQLWWGHRIPVWCSNGEFLDDITEENFGKRWEQFQNEGRIAGLTRSSFIERKEKGRFILADKEHYDTDGLKNIFICVRNSEDTEVIQFLEQRGFEQDPDVLDTWFSSALWPFSTLGWPENTRELQAWNPGAVLCTAREIITLWVSRMVMTNLYFLDRLPFYHVYIHAMIQDGQGRKMSKSLGNGVDPVEIIEKYGADAMRYSLAYLTTGMQDIRMPVKMEKLPDGREINTSERFDIGRNFANKIWNAARFVMMNIEDAPAPRPLDVKQLAHEDRWILSRLNQTVSEMTADLDRYEFSDSAAGIYRFFWNELCDWYLEWIKPRMKENGPSKAQAQQVLAYGLDQTLRLLHPSMPYLTEQLWQYLNEICPSRMIDRPLEIDKGLVRSRWPQVRDGWTDASAERDMDLLQSSIRAFRDVRTNVNRIRSANKEKSLNELPQAVVSCPPGLESFFNRTKSTIAMLGYLADLKVELNAAIPSGSTVKVVTDAAGQSANLIVPLAGLIDIDQERTRIVKELSDLDGHIARSEQRLSNQNFVTKAPPKVLEEHRQKLDELKARRDSLRQALAELK